MKFLILVALLSASASAYNYQLNVAGSQVIGNAAGRGGSGGAGSGSGSGGSGARGWGGSGSGLSGASSRNGGYSGGSAAVAGATKSRGGSNGGSSSAALLGLSRSRSEGSSASSGGGASWGGSSGSIAAQSQYVSPVSAGAASADWGASSGSSSDSAAVAGGVITAAVQTRYRVQYVDVPSSGERAPVQQIVIPANSQPLEIAFQSQSSPVRVTLQHIPGQAAEPQVSSHTEEPDILKSEIVKPIIHEVTEAIQPIRRITQEVRAVEETVTQILARGQEVQQAQAAVQAVRPQLQATVQAANAVTSSQDSAALLGAIKPAGQQEFQQITQDLIDKKRKAKAAARARA